MQITSNTTGMAAGLFVTADKEARDHCVVVVKGTFATDAGGVLRLAAEQRPLVSADEHFGAPESTAIRHECDFVLAKPFTDVLVVGKAVAPGGLAVPRLHVRLEVAGRTKDALVVGERRWVHAVGGVMASNPVPFLEMPLTFDRAFGGPTDRRNPVGVGLAASLRELDGKPLPNVEHPLRPIGSPHDRPEPWGFGSLGRSWLPRLAWAGTYDQRWLSDVCPYLPPDFDSRYHQSAPEDQRFPHFVGGEVIRCVHMAREAVVRYDLPAFRVPMRFTFLGRAVARVGVLDTVILEPHLGLAMLVWRASVPLGKKLNELRGIHLGADVADADGIHGYRGGKPVFTSLRSAVRWRRRQRRAA